MTRFFALLFLLFIPASAMAQGFDCRRARAPDEMAICSDASLREMDEAMTASYYSKRVLAKDVFEKKAISLKQVEFLRLRRKCGPDKTCLAYVYTRWIGILVGED